MKHLTLIFAFFLLFATPAFAQLTSVPYTFISGTTILSSQMNANFDSVEAQALNRAGGTMTGNLLFSADNLLDIGANGATRPRRVYVGTEVKTYDLTLTHDLQGVTATFSGAVTAGGLTFSSGAITGLSSLTASGNIATSGGVFSGNGSSLTNIPETAIANGAVFPRLASDETISGGWTFTKASAPLTVQAGAGTTTLQALSATSGQFSAGVSLTGGVFSGSGASLHSIPETAISDGSTYPRIAANETISGSWTFSNNVTVGTTVLGKGVGLEVVNFGGDWREFVAGGSYPAGVGMDKAIPGSGIWIVDASTLPGTYALEGLCRVASGSATAYIALYNNDTGAAITGGAVSASVGTVPGWLRTGSITFPGGSVAYHVRQQTSSGSVSCFSLRIVRTG